MSLVELWTPGVYLCFRFRSVISAQVGERDTVLWRAQQGLFWGELKEQKRTKFGLPIWESGGQCGLWSSRESLPELEAGDLACGMMSVPVSDWACQSVSPVGVASTCSSEWCGLHLFIWLIWPASVLLTTVVYTRTVGTHLCGELGTCQTKCLTTGGPLTCFFFFFCLEYLVTEQEMSVSVGAWATTRDTTFSLSIHPLMDISVVSHFWILWIE